MRMLVVILALALQVTPAVALCQRDILLFDAHWCGYCRLTKEFFHRQGVHYRTIDIMQNQAHWGNVMTYNFGNPGIPVTIFDGNWNGNQLTAGTVVRGYNERELRAALCLPQ